MKVEVVANPGKGPGINIHGSQVTPLVWDIFNYSIGSNRYDCPWYKARGEAGAFFQGGSGERDGQWVFIEFWKPDTATAYVNLINRALEFVDDKGEPKSVTVTTDDEVMLIRVVGMAKFYDYPTTNANNSITFTPTDVNSITTLVEMTINCPEIITFN